MSIIVEGPDGAGKTTLVQELQHHFPQMELHPRFCTSVGGPIAELTEAVYRDARARPTHFIYDRHPTLSEYVYNTAIPGRRIRDSFLTEAMGRIRERVARNSVTIFCLPPLETVKNNVYEDEEIGNNMPGVFDNVERIYEQYCMHQLMWPGLRATFDYTKHVESWSSLMYLLAQAKDRHWKAQP